MKSAHLAGLAFALSIGAVLATTLTSERLATVAKPGPAQPGVAADQGSRFARMAASGTRLDHASKGLVPEQPRVFGPVVSYSLANGVSPVLASLPAARLNPIPWRQEAEELRVRPVHPIPRDWMDPVRQSVSAAVAAPAPDITFEGINATDSGCGCIPPDTTGAVGKTQYVQMVNSAIAVYDKASGQPAMAPVHINALFSTLPADARCRIDNNGDPVVVYDQIADRWMISQFAVPGGVNGYHECIAVSKTPDATGAYYTYDFLVGDAAKFQDYPHFGLWPDAYYMSTHQFNPSSYIGSGVFAFERGKMLAGQPARFVYFDLGAIDTAFFGHLPASLDGVNPPPVGAPNYFAEVDDDLDTVPPASADVMRLWKFHVDWTDPSKSTFGLGGLPNSIIPVADFTRPACIAQTVAGCVPQPASNTQLDSLGDRLMFRLAYRNFGDHESLVATHTVIADGSAAQHGPRWYEVRDPGGTPTIFQQGTLAPAAASDPLHRWMSSIAQDKFGNIAIAYSTSSSANFPSMAYSGRLVGDPLGSLGQGETQLFAGGGSEEPLLFVGSARTGRWGDYSTLTVDPLNDCTFWYTNEYFPFGVDPSAVWHTRIGSFRLPGCEAKVLPGPITPPAPLLSIGTDYENPDINGAYTLNWSRSPLATGPDLVQSEPAANCTPFFSDNASSLTNWTAANTGQFAASWRTSTTKPAHTQNSAFWATASEEGFGSATLTYNSPLQIPTTGSTTLHFAEFFVNEPSNATAEGEQGVVEVSADNGANWVAVYINRRALSANEGASAFANEDLSPAEVDLSAYRGKSIRLRYRYFQDGTDFFAYVQYGWYVDDISLTNDLWGDITTTSATSLKLVEQPVGEQCYRVRTTNTVGEQPLASPFSNVVRVTVNATNLLPLARLAATPQSGAKPLNVSLSAAASSDPDADALSSFRFDFGDGTAPLTQAGATVSHTYTAVGDYTASVTVTDARGGVSTAATQLISVAAAASNPNPFSFLERTGVATNAFITSEAVKLSGYTGSLPISLGGAGNVQYSINGGAFTASAGNIAVNDSLVLRHLSSAAISTLTTSSVTVGSYTATFKSTTTDKDRVPDAFTFGSKSAVVEGQVVESEPASLVGFNAAAAIVPGPDVEWRIGTGSYSRANGSLLPGQSIQVKHVANSAHLGYTKTYLKIGGVTGYFTSRTR